jgi:hypothetical protein
MQPHHITTAGPSERSLLKVPVNLPYGILAVDVGEAAVTGRATDAEDTLASAIGIPINMIIGLAGLLISKNVISCDEMASLLQDLAERSSSAGENEAMVRMIIETALTQFEQLPTRGSGH